jgi:hypothetical protein
MHGRVQQYQKTSFNNSDLSPSTFDRSTYFSGFTFTLGTIYESIGKLLEIPAIHNLTVGLTLTTSSSLDADVNRTYPEDSYFGGDSTVTEKGTTELPLSIGLGLSYLHQNSYRFLCDLAFNSTYYQLNGVGIDEFLVSGGLGFPMGPESQFNIGMQLGVRGSTDKHLQKDTIIRLSVAVSASEIWFLKFDEE